MKGCSNHAVISELYHEYLQGVGSAVATGGMTQLSSSATEVPKVDTRESERCCGMQGLSCRKKAKFDCEHKMCFNCCSALKQSSLCTWNKCDGHLKARLRKEVEDRYIEEGMSSLGKKGRTTFYHYEEKFMKCGQTVVIWCIRDFLRKKRWHEDTLQQFERLHRTRNLLRRKNRNNVSCNNRKKSATATKGYSGIVDDDDPVKVDGSSKGRRCRRIARDQSYEEIKEKWHRELGLH